MKETVLAHMEVPEEARRISGEPVSKVVNLTTSTADMKTSTFLGWLSYNYIGTVASTAGLVATNYVTSDTLMVLSITGAVFVGISNLAHGLASMIGPKIHRNIKDEVEKQSKPITPDEWKSLSYMIRANGDDNYYGYSQGNSSDSSRGIRIRHRGVKNARTTALLPVRMFKKQMISETVWYEPKKDSFYRETHYMGFTHYTKVTEEFAGRRQSFKAALNSL